jgi:hypothetical protein
MTVSAIFRATKTPLLVGGLAMWWGYFESMLKGKPRYADAEFRSFVRRYQWTCLFFGKASATRRLEERQKPKWLSPTRSA